LSSNEPTEEEIRAALEEELKRIRVEDVLLQTIVTLVNLAGRRLGLAEGTQGEKDLEQAKLAIEGVRALLPLAPEEQMEPVKQAMSQLQMAFAREAQAPAEPAGPPAADAEKDETTEADEAERAKARSKIWTPPGT
jgi:hypothetical protein